MNIILIEDESIALRRLKKLILEINPTVRILAELESVLDAQKWFESNRNLSVDLIFSDIQLSDGLSFEVFESINTYFPIIFTTAYNDYALRAFKLNGVDYLLKPIQKAELEKALAKFSTTKALYSNDQLSGLQRLILNFRQPGNTIPTFISYSKDLMVPFSADGVVYFYTSDRIVYAVTEDRKYVLEESLEEVEQRLPEALFFRANRQFVIQKKFVINAELYFNNRLIVHMKRKPDEKIVISREKSKAFRDWLLE